VWLFFMLMLAFFGYPPAMAIGSTVALYVLYAFIELLGMFTCYTLGNQRARSRLRAHWWLWLFMPGYRFLLFWFRFAGFLNTLTEEPRWAVDTPWRQTKEGIKDLFIRVRRRQRPTTERASR